MLTVSGLVIEAGTPFVFAVDGEADEDTKAFPDDAILGLRDLKLKKKQP